MIDRLVRGRAWIPVLGVMLVGIVAMQVEMLKMNSSIGHSIDRGASLQSQNEQLRYSVATLGDDQRIESIAAKAGMVMPSPDTVSFVDSKSANPGQAVTKISSPDPSWVGPSQNASSGVTSYSSAASASAPTAGNPSSSATSGAATPTGAGSTGTGASGQSTSSQSGSNSPAPASSSLSAQAAAANTGQVAASSQSAPQDQSGGTSIGVGSASPQTSSGN